MVKKFPGGLIPHENDKVKDYIYHLHKHMVTEPASNDTVMHHRLVRLLLEI